jgi:hypothetical protein
VSFIADAADLFPPRHTVNIIISRKQDLEICAHCQKHKSDLENAAAALESDAVRYKIRGVIRNAPQQQGERYYIQEQKRERERDWCLCVCIIVSSAEA